MAFRITWPPGPWRQPNGVHVNPEFAKFEQDLTNALQTCNNISVEMWVIDQAAIKNRVSQNQNNLNFLEGHVQRLPLRWLLMFQEIRSSGEVELDKWARGTFGTPLRHPISVPAPRAPGPALDGYGNPMPGRLGHPVNQVSDHALMQQTNVFSPQQMTTRFSLFGLPIQPGETSNDQIPQQGNEQRRLLEPAGTPVFQHPVAESTDSQLRERDLLRQLETERRLQQGQEQLQQALERLRATRRVQPEQREQRQREQEQQPFRFYEEPFRHLPQGEELQELLDQGLDLETDMNRRFGQQGAPNQGNDTPQQTQRAQPILPQQRRPGDFTYEYGQDPFPPGTHKQIKAIRLLDKEYITFHYFFILDRNTSTQAHDRRREVTAHAKKRREQVGGDLFAVAEAALGSNNPALVKIWDTAQGELFATAVGREDLAVVMYEIDPKVWRLAGVGHEFCEGRLYLLRNAAEGEQE